MVCFREYDVMRFVGFTENEIRISGGSLTLDFGQQLLFSLSLPERWARAWDVCKANF